MREKDELRCRRIVMNDGRGIPVLGFGTLILDPRSSILAIPLRATRVAWRRSLHWYTFAKPSASQKRDGGDRRNHDALSIHGVVETGIPGFIPREVNSSPA